MSEAARNTASIVTFDSYVKDCERLHIEAINLVADLTGDYHFMSKIAYRQKLDSACISVAYGGLTLINKTMSDIKESRNVLTTSLEEVIE